MRIFVFFFLLISSSDIFDKIRSFESFSVEFLQVLFSSSTGKIAEGRAKLFFKNPLFFKLEGENEEVISDGKQVFFVRKDKNKIFSKPISDFVSDNIILPILTGSKDFLKYFDEKIVGNEITLKPKKGVKIKADEIKIYIIDYTFPIKRVKIIKSEFEITLDIKKFKREKIDENFFKPPYGEIIEVK